MNHLDIAEKAKVLGEEMRAYVANMKGAEFRPESPEEVREYVKEHHIDSIRLWFSDLLGELKEFTITPHQLEGAFKQGMGFDGSSVKGCERIEESDMVAFPDPTTARLLPYSIGSARAIRMFTDVKHPRTGEAYEDDSRHILKRNLELLVKQGFSHMNIGPEAEYFYFASDEAPIILDKAGYFTTNPVDAGDPIRELTVLALESMGITVEYHHHEVAPSQHEIDLKYCDALTMADRLQTYKLLVKKIARGVGVHATFMPKPLASENGSGMHTHISLFRGDKNAFYEKEGPHNLSRDAQAFIEGVLRHSQEIALITNPLFNSYRRLVPGFEAPVYVAWAARNRSALIRVPENKQGNEVATRIEVRFPDATCNPYLAFSVLLAGGLKGLHHDWSLRDEEKEDLYHLDAVERERRGIPSLPHDLYDAIKTAEGSELLEAALGKSAQGKLVEMKLRENDEYRLAVTQLELERGLHL